MKTPQDIKDRSFAKAVFGGYDMAGVDEFIDKLAEDYESLYKENAILKSKLKVLVEKVEEYRNTEDSMRIALSTAKKMAEDMVQEAKKKTESMVLSANNEASSKVSQISRLVENEERKLKAAQKVTAEFVDMSMGLCRQHLTFLQKLGELKESEPEVKEVPVQRTENITDAAKDIENSVTRVFSAASDVREAKRETTQEPPARAKLPEGWEDDDEPTAQRPKFEFSELKFGNNYKDEEN